MAGSDFAPTDDMAPIPVAPMAEVAPVIEEDQQADDTEDAKLAAAYWHPAWEKVQDKMQETLDSYGDPGNAVAYKDMPADEFKIKMLTEATVRAEWNKIMEDVKRAVQSVEQQQRKGPKPAKQPRSGT